MRRRCSHGNRRGGCGDCRQHSRRMAEWRSRQRDAARPRYDYAARYRALRDYHLPADVRERLREA